MGQGLLLIFFLISGHHFPIVGLLLIDLFNQNPSISLDFRQLGLEAGAIFPELGLLLGGEILRLGGQLGVPGGKGGFSLGGGVRGGGLGTSRVLGFSVIGLREEVLVGLGDFGGLTPGGVELLIISLGDRL